MWFLQYISDQLHAGIYFALYKATVAAVRRPCVVIGAALAVTLACSVGILSAETVSGGGDVWSPFESRTQDQSVVFDRFFPQSIRVSSVYLQPRAGQGGNMLSDHNMAAAFDVHEGLLGVVGGGRNFSAVCFIPPGQEACQVTSLLGAWGFNRAAALAQTPAQRYAAVRAAFPDLTSLVGGHDAAAGTLRSFNIFYAAGSDAARGVTGDHIDAWEEAFLEYAQAPGRPLLVHALHSRSITDELDRAIGGDTTLLAVGVVLMVSYSMVVITRRCSAVGLRLAVPGAAVVSVFLGVGVGYGLTAWSGVPFTALNSVLPLILLAIGIDNAYVLTAAWDARADPSLAVPPGDAPAARSPAATAAPGPLSPKSAGEAADEAEHEHEGCGVARDGDADVHAKAAAIAAEGATVLFTTTTDVVAFLFGSMTQVPAMHWFTLYAAASVAFILLAELTFFLACLELDTRRQAAGRWECLCCLQHPVAAAAAAAAAAAPAPPATGAAATTGSPPRVTAFANPSLTKSTALAKWMHKTYVPLLLTPSWQAGVVAFFAALLAFNGWAITQVPQGQPLSDLVPDDSYVVDWLDTREVLYDDAALSEFDLFATGMHDDARGAAPLRPGELPPAAAGSFVDHACTRHVRAAYAARAALQRMPQYVNPASFSVQWWYPAWVAWLASPAGRALAPLPLLPANSTRPGADGEPLQYTLVAAPSCDAFVGGLQAWAGNSSAARAFAPDLVLGSSPRAGGAAPRGELRAARFSLRFLPAAVRDSTEQVTAVFAVRDEVDAVAAGFASDLQAYSGFFFFTELDAIIVTEAITNIGLAAAGVTVVALVFLGSVSSALLVVATLLLIDVFLLGLIFWAGLKINSVSIVNLILSLGLALDYSAHIAHSFTVHLRRVRKIRAAAVAAAAQLPQGVPGAAAAAGSDTWTVQNVLRRRSHSGAGGGEQPSDVRGSAAGILADPRPDSHVAIDHAISTLGASVFNGAFSTFLAMVPLGPAGSNIFRTFFRMFTGITVLGGLPHGLVLLPVVLLLLTAANERLAGMWGAQRQVAAAKAPALPAPTPEPEGRAREG